MAPPASTGEIGEQLPQAQQGDPKQREHRDQPRPADTGLVTNVKRAAGHGAASRWPSGRWRTARAKAVADAVDRVFGDDRATTQIRVSVRVGFAEGIQRRLDRIDPGAERGTIAATARGQNTGTVIAAGTYSSSTSHIPWPSAATRW